MSFDIPTAELLLANKIDLLDPVPGIASRVQSNDHFMAYLRAVPAKHRRQAYDALKLHLKFKVKPFYILNSSKKHVALVDRH